MGKSRSWVGMLEGGANGSTPVSLSEYFIVRIQTACGMRWDPAAAMVGLRKTEGGRIGVAAALFDFTMSNTWLAATLQTSMLLAFASTNH